MNLISDLDRQTGPISSLFIKMSMYQIVDFVGHVLDANV